MFIHNGVFYPIFLFFLSTIIIQLECRHIIDKECLQCNKNETFSFFWKIERKKPSPPSYFFGTIHAPYTKVWNYIPNRAKQAFRHSQHIIFELDLMNTETLLSLTQCQLLPPGIRLSDIIPIDIYYRLQRHLRYIRLKIPQWITNEQKSHGLNANALFTAITLHWERKRPIWVMIMLNSLTENDIKSKGITVLDSFFYQKAKKLKKSIGSVENAKEQCKTLNYLNTTQVLYALNQTLLQHENIRFGHLRSNHTTNDMINHYNCGNLNEALFNEDSSNIPILKNHSSSTSDNHNDDDNDDVEKSLSKNIENYFRFEIILKRNKRMSRRVLELLQTNPNESFFFVFGAGHFLGNDSIIELMMKDHSNGFEIIHINDDRQQKQSLICDTTVTTTTTTRSIIKQSMNNVDHQNQQQQSEETLIYPISTESLYRLPLSWFHNNHQNQHNQHSSMKMNSDSKSSIDDESSAHLPVVVKDSFLSEQKIQWPLNNMINNWNKDLNHYPLPQQPSSSYNNNNNNQAMFQMMMMKMMIMMKQQSANNHHQQQQSQQQQQHSNNNNNIHYYYPINTTTTKSINHNNQNRTNMKMDNIGLTGHTFANHHHDYNRHHRHQIRSNNDNYYPSYQTAKLFTGLLDNGDDDDESNHPAHNTRTLSSSSSSLYSLNNSCQSRINIDGHFFLMIIIILMIYIRI
ncbi:metalloprotease TIKI1-like isoform X2 [Dermatophagoides pteronyssinus]|uniref:metalloprotease TIKI1-like isoform X2 n=1 Tax=Dermatophagoides pteronyssinus TaxID=6956 RepID=UPI003F674F19